MNEFYIDNYFFETEEIENNTKYLVVIIYDISDNRRRAKLSKYLQGYGFRVQRSSFEAILDKKVYNKLIKGIPPIITKEDNVKLYKLSGSCEVKSWGTTKEVEDEEVIIIWRNYNKSKDI